MPCKRLLATLLLFVALSLHAEPPPATGQVALPESRSEPISIGRSHVLHSRILDEQRRINVYLPSGYEVAQAPALPVMYMPDGGLREDFLHVAGLLQVSVGNWSMRPFLLVGIENTERRRDLTGPTEVESDRSIAPRVGGSARFRDFIRDELKPFVAANYRVTGESAIVGESLAGLFIVETLMLEPDMFDSYLAFDPSLWWNDSHLVRNARKLVGTRDMSGKQLFLAHSNQAEIAAATRDFATVMGALGKAAPRHVLRPMEVESHSTIYHPAALLAFRSLFARPVESP